MGIPAFERFIAELRALWTREPDMRRRMEQAKPLLERLVLDPTLKAQSAHWPSTEGRKNLLFHVDDEHGFAINAVVREPGRIGGVHDHAHAWVLYGLSTAARASSAMTGSMTAAARASPR